MNGQGQPLRWWLPWALLGFFTLHAFASGFSHTDEAWFLQVTRRVLGGETPYRDVYFGAGPLSLYLALPFAWVTGSAIWGQKAILILAAAATALAALRVVRQLGGSSRRSLWAAVGLAGYGAPLPDSLYSPVGTALLVLTASLALDAVAAKADEEAKRTAVWAGIAAGLCLAAKQNYGALALVALLAALGLASRNAPRTRAIQVGVALASSLGVLVLLLLPALLWAGPQALADCLFAGKGHYLRIGGISYLEGLRDLARPSGLTLGGLEARYRLSAFVLPALAGAAGVLAWPRLSAKARPQALTVGLFSVAALAGVFPRADIWHVGYTPPLFVAALAVALSAPGRLLRYCLAAGLAVGLMWPLTHLLRLLTGEACLSGHPHFRGLLVDCRVDGGLSADRRALASLGDAPALLLSNRAGFFYLTTGLANPTPYDYPVVSALGKDGLQRLMRDVSEGRLGRVYLDREGQTGMSPAVLVDAVRLELRPRGRRGPWEAFGAGVSGSP